MINLFLNRFKEYVNTHYSDCNLKITDICSNIGCSVSTLQRILASYYDYSIMKYVEYVRILKAIELICKGERKVYCMVGYKSSSVFSRAFLRVTGFNARCFFPYQFADNKNLIKTALDLKTEDPKEVIETIIKNVSMKSILSINKKSQQKQKKSKYKQKRST